MAIDGLFIHYLTIEIKQKIMGGKINKITQTSPTTFVFSIYQKRHYNLLIDLNTTSPYFNLTNTNLLAPSNPYNMGMLLRKYLDGGIIKDLYQYGNDRIVTFVIENYNEIGDLIYYHLIIEATGKSANLILTNENLIVIDALKKQLSLDENLTKRIIYPKSQYHYPDNQNKINPFIVNEGEEFRDFVNLEGIGKFHLNILKEIGNLNTFLKQEIKPVLYNIDHKLFPSCMAFNGYQYDVFPSFSELLDTLLINSTYSNNPMYLELKRIITKRIHLLENKLDHLYLDLEEAKSHQKDLEKAQLIQTYLYKIQKGMKEIYLPSLSNDELILITLDPLKDGVGNMQKHYKSYKKYKNAINYIEEQRNITNEQIAYFQELLIQLELTKEKDQLIQDDDYLNTLNNIKMELINLHLIKSPKTTNKKKTIPHIKKYQVDDVLIYVGKCNSQNNYLISSVARASDYWFHVKDAPSAHIIVRGELNERIIRIASLLASLNSKYEKSSSVMVDYTLFKYVKKIPKALGCKVTYTNQSSIYIDPSIDTLKELLKPSN